MTAKRYQFGDRNLTASQWFKEPEVVALGIPRETFESRLGRGWSIAKAISEPCDAAHRTRRSVGKREMRNGRKSSIYLPTEMVEELLAEAHRLDKPVSWVVQQCVRGVLPKMKGYPSPDDVSLVESPSEEESGR